MSARQPEQVSIQAHIPLRMKPPNPKGRGPLQGSAKGRRAQQRSRSYSSDQFLVSISARAAELPAVLSTRNFGSSAESVGEFRLGKAAKAVIEGDFDGAVGAESVGSFRDDTHLAVEALDRTDRELASGAEPVEDERAVAAQHPGHFLHRFASRAQGPGAPPGEG